MRKIIISTFIIGLVLGLVLGLVFAPPRTKYVEPSMEFSQHRQFLLDKGFLVERKAYTQHTYFWIGTGIETFEFFVVVAEEYNMETIYYSTDTYGDYYFWFYYPTTDYIARWNIQ